MIGKIRKKLSNQIQKVSTFLYLRKNLKLNKDFFLSGRYYFLMDLKPMLYLKDDDVKKFSSRNINSFRKNISKVLNVKVNSKYSCKYKGELMMSDRKGNIKVFDITNGYTYTIIKDLEYYQVLHKVSQEMQDIYNLTFLDFDDKNKVIRESYIDFKKRGLWTDSEFDSAIKEVCENTKKSLIKARSKDFQSIETLRVDFYDKKTNKEYKKLVINLIPDDAEDEAFSVIRSHGDMNFNNLLLKDGIFYAIDWDESRDTVFFYDFFHMIFADWKWYLNPYFIKRYFNGEYDELLADIFLYSNRSYNKNNKRIYLSVYLMNRYLMFENSNTHKLNEMAISMTIRALKNLDSY